MKPTIRRLAELGAEERDRLTHRSLDRIFDPELWASVRSIYEDVAAAGDGALCAALQRFDGVDAAAGELRVSDAELDGAGAKLAPELRDALDSMITALRAYNERVLRDADWREEIAPGVVVGERARPIASAALYVPCGKGSFPSVMAHLGVPAAVAGVRQVVVLTPPLRIDRPRRSGLSLHRRATRAARGLARQRPERHRGRRAGQLLDPARAQDRRAGQPRRDRGAAARGGARRRDEHAAGAEREPDPRRRLGRPVLLALDLLTEAEHGSDSAATLVTWSEALAEAVAAAVEPRLAALPQAQREFAATTLTDLGGILICADEAEACAFANEYAVEHLQIATADPEATLARIEHAAEILIGQNTPMAAANFTIGVPNTLPSGGFAAVSSGVTARTFLAVSSLAELSAEGLAAVGPPARLIAEYERFPAHVQAVRERGL